MGIRKKHRKLIKCLYFLYALSAFVSFSLCVMRLCQYNLSSFVLNLQCVIFFGWFYIFFFLFLIFLCLLLCFKLTSCPSEWLIKCVFWNALYNVVVCDSLFLYALK